MSHVVSSQPSATSPYQPTAMQDTGNGTNFSQFNPTTRQTTQSEEGQDDCCINTRNKSGLCLGICSLLSIFCQITQRGIENCCECCADCLNDCCEDKPRNSNRSNVNQRYTTSRGYNSYYDNTTDDPDWGVSSLSEQQMRLDIANSQYEPSFYSETHHGSGQDSGSHHTSVHDSGTCHAESDGNDDGGGCYDSGGGDDGGGCCDSGGGYDGGGCDSGGGADGGGGCDSGGGNDD